MNISLFHEADDEQDPLLILRPCLRSDMMKTGGD